MNPTAGEPDVSLLIPRFEADYAAAFAVGALISVFLLGRFLRRRLRLAPRFRVECLALDGALGIVGQSFLAWILYATTHSREAMLQGTAGVSLLLLIGWLSNGRRARHSQEVRPRIHFRSPLARGEMVGYVLIGLLVVGYLVQTVPLFDFDGQRLRLYGAAFTDKTTNMMSCAALLHDLPPDCLRFAGRKFPSHYFPHLYVANMLTSDDNLVANFWFYVPTLGIVVNGLAILAFGRRVLKSYAAGCIGLVVYGLTSVTPQLKPLDVTPALALVALIALDRFRRTGLKRWGATSVVLIGAMPCFETFHALLMVAALGLWGAASFGRSILRARRFGAARELLPWRLLAVPALAGAAAFGSLQMLYLGERPVAPPTIKVDSVFGDSYRNTWDALARDDDRIGHAIATLDRWKRKPKPTDEPSVPVAWYERASAKILYTLGIPVYVFCRFVHLASFGIVHLWRRRRTSALRPSELVIGAAAFIGFSVPWLIDIGITADGKWWSSPNLYRPTEFGSWLLALLGTGVMLQCATQPAVWKRPATWGIALIAGYWLATVTAEHQTPTTTYLEVPAHQLNALAYLRGHVDYEAIVVHPWSDCEIRDAAKGDAVSFVYKRHFTLGSNLAGRTMFYEGREDYTFSNGFIAPEEVYRRSRARKKFYTEPDDATLAAVLDFRTADGHAIEYVVEDAKFPAPAIVRAAWPIVYRSGDVVIRRRPEAK